MPITPTINDPQRPRLHRHIFVFVLCTCLALLSTSCTRPETCKQGDSLNKTTLNPEDSPCQFDCECNNLRYSGICCRVTTDGCKAGSCRSYLRENCQQKGTTRTCPIPKEWIATTTGKHNNTDCNGIQTCSPPEFDGGLYWSDCRPLGGSLRESTSSHCKDGLDNDCDGKIDGEDPDCQKICPDPLTCSRCQPFRLKTCSKDLQNIPASRCPKNIQQCKADGTWGECQAPKELCNNGLDDDCDGLIDPDCPCVENSTQPCHPGQLPPTCYTSKMTCTNKRWGPCTPTPAPEICANKIDDNCNGQIDENCSCPPGTTETCTLSKMPDGPSSPECIGVRICGATGEWGACLGAITPTTESCNGKDDDCDGYPDNSDNKGTPLQKPCFQDTEGCLPQTDGSYKCTSPCKTGLSLCENGLWSPCKDSQLPQREQCNGKDDDCDGTIDNLKEPGLCPLQAGVCAGSRPKDTAQCKNGQWICSTKNYTEHNPHYNETERCDQFDNNCSGQTNEGLKLCVGTLAGAGTRGSADGLGTRAQLNTPAGLAYDAKGNLYIADMLNHRLRVLAPDGRLSTLSGSKQGHLDGPLSKALFDTPSAIAIGPQGAIYVAHKDGARIRKIDLSSSQVTTIAGDGQCKFDPATKTFVNCYLDGPAATAQFNEIVSMAFSDDGHLYLVDRRNHRIRKLNLNTKEVSTVAGDGKCHRGTNNTPVDCDRVGSAEQAQFHSPSGIVAAGKGIFYICDRDNHKIRKLDLNTRIVTTFAGNGKTTPAEGPLAQVGFDSPTGIALTADKQLLIVDSGLYRLLKLSNTTVSIIAGNSKPGSRDGPPHLASFQYPEAIAIHPKGSILAISDPSNSRIRHYTGP